MRTGFWHQIRDYAFCPDYKPGSAKFDAFKTGAAYARDGEMTPFISGISPELLAECGAGRSPRRRAFPHDATPHSREFRKAPRRS